jgi:hypothetical protein
VDIDAMVLVRHSLSVIGRVALGDGLTDGDALGTTDGTARLGDGAAETPVLVGAGVNSGRDGREQAAAPARSRPHAMAAPARAIPERMAVAFRGIGRTWG